MLTYAHVCSQDAALRRLRALQQQQQRRVRANSLDSSEIAHEMRKGAYVPPEAAAAAAAAVAGGATPTRIQVKRASLRLHTLVA
jgi:hypothetical protein